MTSDLVSLPIEMVIAQGNVLAETGRLAADLPPYVHPACVRGTVKMGGA
jgi:adenine deaminase